jgi:hypothetical protein
MTTNKDGFEVNKIVDVDDLLTHQAKMRQKAKGEKVKPNKDAELITLLNNELASQKVRLKPLGLELLAQSVRLFFQPVKKAVVKKAD